MAVTRDFDPIQVKEPSYTSKVATTHRVLVAGLGDGYTVRAGDGLNSKKRIWDLEWDNAPTTEIDTYEAFFTTCKGYIPFYWTPPRGTRGKFTCTTYSRTPVGPDTDSLTATFEEVYDI